jgi:hypothetical protein
MPLTMFPVVGKFQAVVSDATDLEGEPDIENISSFVYFSPSVEQVFSATDHVIYRLRPFRARTNPDLGQVLNIDGTQVSLPANTPDLQLANLTYLVTFDHVVVDEREGKIDAFRFAAPPDATLVDLSTVERIPVKVK